MAFTRTFRGQGCFIALVALWGLTRAAHQGLRSREELNLPQPSSVLEIYSKGSLQEDLFSVGHWLCGDLLYGDMICDVRINNVPQPLLIGTPMQVGVYPVVYFQHGFWIRNRYYSEMIRHIASHGFIVVAPQLSFTLNSDATEDIRSAASVIDWLDRTGLDEAFSRRNIAARPDLTKLAIAGHSRGGKVVFGLATGVHNSTLKYSAIIGIDPVDGSEEYISNPPPITQPVRPLDLPFPTLIVGAALGGSCAPAGVNHEAFYKVSGPPAYHFVATQHGHLDFLDNLGPSLEVGMRLICERGYPRSSMRQFSAGIVVAFLQYALLSDDSQLIAAISNPSDAPVEFDVSHPKKTNIYLRNDIVPDIASIVAGVSLAGLVADTCEHLKARCLGLLSSQLVSHAEGSVLSG